MLPPNMILLQTDRLSLSALGAYGNAAAETPAFDRLASCSGLFDRCYALNSNPHSLFEGEIPLLRELARRDYRMILLTDDPQLARRMTRCEKEKGLKQLIYLPTQETLPTALPEEIEETALYQFFEQNALVIEELCRETTPFFLWSYTQGLGGMWDFPEKLRLLFREDEEDPLPYDGMTPPSGSIAVRSRRRAADAEEILPDDDFLCSVQESYAAGISLWDRGLEFFLATLTERNYFENGLLALTSPRGFPLGEHGVIGERADGDPVFYAEEIHLPLLLRLPGKSQGALRSNALTTPADLEQTLLCAASGIVPPQPLGELLFDPNQSGRSQLNLQWSRGEKSFRGLITRQWFLREETNGERVSEELYLLPDDRNQINDVADRCLEEVEELRKSLL